MRAIGISRSDQSYIFDIESVTDININNTVTIPNIDMVLGTNFT